ncbi:MAG: flagellar filament capping protein FliD [Armatimonadota bacterium]
MAFGGGISFGGISSGIDTESIIARILQLERQPIQRLLIQKGQLTNRQTAVDQYKSLVGNVRTAAQTLNTASTFQLVQAASSDSAVATITAGTGALPGIYDLAVSRLAQTHKLASAAQTDATTALNLSGTFLVNGKAVTVQTNDSLSAVATKINEAGAGVTASIINGGSGNTFLTITANSSGADNKVALSDVASGTVMSSLGFLSGAASIRKAITNGAESIAFTDSVSTIGSLLNVTVPPSTIQINGTNVSVDFANDSLADLASRITANVPNVTATVVSAEQNGETVYKLQIVGDSATPTFTDENRVLENIGILQTAFGNELLAAQDAQFTLDGVSLTSASNTVTNIISGATITLLKADAVTPPKTTLSLTRDNEAIRNKVQELADAYNAVVDFLKSAASFDSETLESGPLFGNSTVSLIQEQMARALLQSPDGVTGPYRNLLAIGVNFDSSGKMTLDTAKFDEALATNLQNVTDLFVEAGRIDDPDIQFISATSKTKPSGLVGYTVNITQLATQGTMTAGVAFTGTSSQEETLTFGGTLFGNTAYNLTVPAGTTIDTLIALINQDAKLKDHVVASKTASNELVLTSKKYGSPGNFTVQSNLPAASDNSGIGDSLISVTGLDVAGTINGETATGTGQILKGDAGNANTDGLSILVKGGSTGDRGQLIFTKGAASVVEEALDVALDFVNGFLTSETNAIQAQIDDINDRVARIEENLVRREEFLRRQFNAMEEAMAALQAQSAQLASIMANISVQGGR